MPSGASWEHANGHSGCLKAPGLARENAPLRRFTGSGFGSGDASDDWRGMDDPPNGRGRPAAGAERAQRVRKGRGRGRQQAASVDSAHATSGRRMDLVSESSAMRAVPSLADDCRRLAERLRLDAVGVAVGVEPERHVTWWAAPDGPPLPSRLDDVLGGDDSGWLLVPVGSDSTVFARPTHETPERAIDVLRAMAASLVASAGGVHQPEPAPLEPAEALPAPDGADRDQAGLWEGTGTPGLAGVLATLARDTGFETGSLYASNGIGWELVARGGPTRPWHAVLDPSRLGPAGEGVRFADAHDVPGIGPRLAALGCSSLAVMAIDGDGRVVLDSSTTHLEAEWMTRALPHLAMIGAVGAEPELATAERSARELAVIERCAEAARRMLEDTTSTHHDLLRELRQALEADEIYHLVERPGAGDVDVVSGTGTDWPRRIPKEIRDTLRSLPVYGPVDEATARQLGTVLGATSHHLTVAFTRERRPQEALVAGWRNGPGLSHPALRSVAQLAGGARAVIESRRSAVDTMMNKE